MANLKENKRFHFTYKTTNLINGRYYLGMHSTNRIDDGYLGSGKRLYYELNKYGRNNFKFEILEQFDSREQLVQAEINLITEQDLKNTNCLNLKQGGQGGWSDEVREKGKAAAKTYMVEKWKDQEFRKYLTEVIREQRKKEYREGSRENMNKGHWAGRKHTQDSIEKMKQSHKQAGIGADNSQYGTCWITNELESRKIHRGDIIPEGWRLGRKLKNGNDSL